MTQRFISVWCYEHDFNNKVGVAIYLENLEESELIEDNFSEDGCYITTPNTEYTIFNWEDVNDMIEEKKSQVRYEILDSLQNSDLIEDYINWDKYFEEHEIDKTDVLPQDYQEVDFERNTYFVIEN